MSTLNRDYDDVLRRALRAAADSVEPSADGLERIRARLSGPPLLSFASASTWYSDAATRFTTWAAPFLEAALNAFWAVVDRFRPGGAYSGRSGRRYGWLRPLAAMGTAIFVVAAGAFAIMTLPQAIAPGSAGFTIFGSHHSGSGGGSGKKGVAGSATPLTHGPSAPGVFGGSSVPAPSSAACKSPGTHKTGSVTPTPKISSSTTPSAPATSSPPVSASPTTDPAPTTDPTPTPSGTGTPDPGSVTTLTPSASPADGTTAKAVASARSAVMVPSKSSSPSAPCPSPSSGKKASSSPYAVG